MKLIEYAVVAAFVALGTPGVEEDVEILVGLHEKALEAHLEGDVEMLLEDEADDYVVSSRGEVSQPTKAERRSFLGPYLESTEFEVYRDEIQPIVKVSEDGTLGWVTVQIYARGVQPAPEGDTAPIEFTSSWIELYEKRDGRWIRVGNVSNFAP